MREGREPAGVHGAGAAGASEYPGPVGSEGVGNGGAAQGAFGAYDGIPGLKETESGAG